MSVKADEWSDGVADGEPSKIAVAVGASQSSSILAAEAGDKSFDDNKFYGSIIEGTVLAFEIRFCSDSTTVSSLLILNRLPYIL
jgi:hypothetical protein